ncbi:MAG: PQQ-binding-like beta-propeller repeat protein [Chloroflexi bacterium]|nr:PQQ-binding-like beta-propeller repeat protein [Chloroflexota bacterium]
MIDAAPPNQTNTTTAPARDEKPSNAVADTIGIIVAFTIVAAVAWVLAQPWVSRDAPGGMLNRYAPLRDGSSFLLRQQDGAGKAIAWQSQNIAVLAHARALAGQLRKAPREAIQRHFGQSDSDGPAVTGFLAQFAHLDIVEIRINSLDTTGTLRNNSFISVRSPDGDFLVSLFEPDQPDPDIVFDPPALNMPSDLRQGNTWQGEGNVSNGLRYLLKGRVTASGAYCGTGVEYNVGQFDDCIQVETTLTLTNDQQTVQNLNSRNWYCADIGMVEEQTLDTDGKVVASLILAGSDRHPPNPQALPPVATFNQASPRQNDSSPTQPGNVDISTWQLTRVGRLGQDIAAGPSTIAPVWIPGNPPLLLVAGYGGELTAFDASDPTGVTRWQFHTQGRIYSPPGFDPATGRIYFGATDKHLYALDARGLFLWSYETGDNIASQPLVARGDDGAIVIFGSEDRYIYGLDAESGQLRWRVRTGGAVVSSAALLPSPPTPLPGGEGGTEKEGRTLVVIGSDDGGVYALEPTTGEQAWLFSTGDAVEAPIVIEDNVVYVASRDHTLYALDGANGQALWTADGGDVLRSAPAAGESAIYVVQAYGGLSAFDRSSGKPLWSTVEKRYVGPPVVIATPAGEAVLVADTDGNVHRFGSDGQRQDRWPVTDATFANDAPAQLEIGLSTSGLSAADKALWFADRDAVVRRLGPALTGTIPLALAWSISSLDAPLGAYLYAGAAEYNGRAILVDAERRIHLVEPATGAIQAVGHLGAASGVVFVEPVISGDTLLVTAQDTLYAVSLKDGAAVAGAGGWRQLPPRHCRRRYGALADRTARPAGRCGVQNRHAPRDRSYERRCALAATPARLQPGRRGGDERRGQDRLHQHAASRV